MNIARKMMRLFQKRALVIMYHRIGTYSPDPWYLSVSERNFEQHLQVLQDEYRVVPLEQLVGEQTSGALRKKTVAITFDDGYLDNYSSAFPLLKKYKLPATFFIATNNIDQDKNFWWDELERLVLFARHLPQSLRIDFPDEKIECDLQKETVLSDNIKKQYDKWKGEDSVPNLRCQAYLKIWRKLNKLSVDERNSMLEEIRAKAGLVDRHREAYAVMNIEQLRQIAAHPLMSVGAHSVNHPMLANQPVPKQREEIVGSRIWLEDRLQKKITTFAYPHGSFNDGTRNLLRDNGFNAGFSTFGNAITRESDPFALGRFQVSNSNGNQFQKMMKGWRSQFK